MRIHFLSAAIAVSAAACSSSSSAPAGTTDSGPVGDSAGASCTPAPNLGAVVNKDHDAAPPPAMTGGTIVDGVYTLTKMVQYNGENGNTPHKETMVFAGGNGQVVGAKDGTGPDVIAYFSYSASGNDLTLTLTCGGSGTVKMKYTATATELTTVNVGDVNELHTFTKK